MTNYIHGQPSTHSRPQQPHHEASQSGEHYRMELNNAAVMWGLAVSYELESCTGPAHNPEWVSTVHNARDFPSFTHKLFTTVGESPRAVGYGKSKSAAKEQAAKIALEVMHDLGYRHPSRS
ncbi:hypothetical protein H0H93_004064 [Arthromyces matolae]|nr:hypothetical protein H0H93_004064 [Arthromyces matolae]